MNRLICYWTGNQKWLYLLSAFQLLTFHQAHKIMLRQRVEEKPGFRLPRHAAPTNYKLRLWPNATNKTFRGTVDIALSVYNRANNVTLHTRKLAIESVSLESYFLEKITISTQVITDSRELLIVKTQKTIPDGRYILKIYFTGTLDGTVGLYASSLKNGRTMIASSFEAINAREAFPCFDEPDFKATFDVTLVVPQNYVALSNMNEISRTLDNDTASEAVTFATSVPMSTYLVCLVICEFDFKETEINSNAIGKNFKLRSFAEKEQFHKVDFALDIGKNATEFYINYFQVPFPLSKLDMIASPAYLQATEQWGLITFADTDFLVDETAASAQNKILVATVVAHELAHMWFGNLVTMKWWDDIWLKEGFAQYMESKCVNAIEPSWPMLDWFLVRSVQPVLMMDSSLSSHPIVRAVETPDQVSSIYDEVSYLKGAALLRMIEGGIGEEYFRNGISDYLKKHKFSNTVTQDLFVSIAPYFKKDYPGLNLTYIMDTWTKQMGYPLLTVEQEFNTYVITQSRFCLNPKAVLPQDSEFNYRWFVPITYKTNKGINKEVVWFEDETETVRITEKDINWLKINNDQVGFYRVNYPLDMWQSLIEQLQAKSDQLTTLDRAHLLDDVFAIAEAGLVPYSLAFSLTMYLTVEEDYAPWCTAAVILNRLSDKLVNSLAYEKMRTYIQRLVSPIYAKQNWEARNLGMYDRLLRTEILTLSTHAGLPAAEEKVRSIFLAWLNSHGTAQPKPIAADLRNLVYYYGMKYASQAEWDKLWEIYKKEEDAQEQVTLRSALAAPRNTEILSKYLMLAWDDSHIERQTYLYVIFKMSSNPSGISVAWDHVRGHWPKIVSRYTLRNRLLGILVQTLAQSFNTELKLKEMQSFFKQYPEAGAGALQRAQALERVRNNIEWTAARAPQVADWLETRVARVRVQHRT